MGARNALLESSRGWTWIFKQMDTSAKEEHRHPASLVLHASQWHSKIKIVTSHLVVCGIVHTAPDTSVISFRTRVLVVLERIPRHDFIVVVAMHQVDCHVRLPFHLQGVSNARRCENTNIPIDRGF